jgi:hypothetical protein
MKLWIVVWSFVEKVVEEERDQGCVVTSELEGSERLELTHF